MSIRPHSRTQIVGDEPVHRENRAAKMLSRCSNERAVWTEGYGRNNQHEVEEVEDKHLLDKPCPRALLVKIKYRVKKAEAVQKSSAPIRSSDLMTVTTVIERCSGLCGN